MAISRITGSSAATSTADWAFVGQTPNGTSMFDISGNGSDGTIAGARYRVIKMTTPGAYSFAMERAGKIDYLIVGAGGPGGATYQTASGAGGGGGGGVLLAYGATITSVNVTATVPNGRTGPFGSSGVQLSGENAVLLGWTAFGGGIGGGTSTQSQLGQPGGSGGGTTTMTQAAQGIVGQGNNGGFYSGTGGGTGGGGAGGVGANSYSTIPSSTPGAIGSGGPGLLLGFDGTSQYYSPGGGAGQLYNGTAINSNGGLGGGGQGGVGNASYGNNPTSGVIGAAGGGSGGTTTNQDAKGGNSNSGAVMIRFRIS